METIIQPSESVKTSLSNSAQQGLPFERPGSVTTGALKPAQPIFKNGFKVDWLEVTIRNIDPMKAIDDFLGLDPNLFVKLDHGMHRYPDCLQYGHVFACYSSTQPERGTKLILGGQALEEVSVDAVNIIRRTIRYAHKPTEEDPYQDISFARIDIAFDDFTGVLSFDGLFDAIMKPKEERKLVTRFWHCDPRTPYWLVGDRAGSRRGESFSFGKSDSQRFLTFYNKRLERIAYHIDKKEPIPEIYDHPQFNWWRVEGRWKKASAKNIALEIYDTGLGNAAGMLRGMVDFRELDSDVDHQDRRTVCEWWETLLGFGEIMRTGRKKAIKSIDEKARYLFRNMRKMIGQVGAILGADKISEIMRAGAKDTTEEEWKRLFQRSYIDPQKIGWCHLVPSAPPDCPF
ncbi:MAG: hypothetical protein C0620_10875 [Desulfuromonas sp.]|nr:MAG: hypothetical protein C0620_10875 [Desulfuromonas sp.]